MPQTTLSGNNSIDAILSTYQWGTSNGTAKTLTYSFPDSGSTWPSGYGDNEPFSPNSYSILNTDQRLHFTEALALWSDVANLTFTETADNVSSKGDIRVAFSSVVTGSIAGYAYYPISTSAAESGDIWLNTNTTDFSPGSQGFTIFHHELGHALGLKHPFDSDSSNSTVLSGPELSTQYSTMTYEQYSDYSGAGYTEVGNTNSFYKTQASTAMLYDIAAIQFLYGANTSTRSGDDTYTFSNSAPEFKTIWDAGGTDSFDLSNQSMNMDINLSAGSFSSIGVITHKLVGSFIQATNEKAVDNIAIAYNVEIENAIGGSGNDTITGNSLANQLTGGAGNDSLNGGSGDDTAIFTGNRADYLIETVNSNLQITANSSNEGIDTLTGIEKLQFADGLFDAATLASVSIPTIPSEVDTTPTEGNSNHINYFLLQIGKVLSIDASVDYITRDGTALAGQDYIATSGTVTITAGETSTVIGVEIIADTISESDETFLLAITNPQGGIFPDGVTEITASRTIIDDDSVSAKNTFSEIEILGVDASIPV